MLLIPVSIDAEIIKKEIKKCNNVIFLHKGCLRYSYRKQWEEQKKIYLTYHFKSAEEINEARIVVWSIYEKVLMIMTEFLNEIHGEKRSNRYWRIIIGAWLLYFLECLYERYCSIKDVLHHFQNIESIGIDRNQFIVPNNSQEYFEYIKSDVYNLQLYTEIFDLLNVKYSIVDIADNFLPRYRLQTSQEVSVEHSRKKYDGIIFALSYFSQYAESLLMQKIQVPTMSTWSTNFDTPCAAINNEIRNKMFKDFIKKMSGDTFESLVAEVLYRSVPVCYIETHKQIKEMSKLYYKFVPKVILSAVSWYNDEFFKIWSAECMESGTSILTIQHGGVSQGTLQAETVSKHLSDIGDKHYSWGWVDLEKSHIKPMPAQKMCGRPLYKTAVEKKEIIYLLTCPARFSVSLSCGMTFEFERLLNQGIIFAKCLSLNTQKMLRVRTHYEDAGWDINLRWREKCPQVVIEAPNMPLGERLMLSRMMVTDNLQTTFFEALSMNIPTMLFLERDKLPKMRESAEWFFDELHSVGILHYSPESAAELINEKYDTIYEWWQDPVRQHVRRRICDAFCRTSDTWLDEWCKELESVFSKLQTEEDSQWVNSPVLISKGKEFIKIGKYNRVVIIGANPLGAAVAEFFSYCKIVAIVDTDDAREGQDFIGMKICSMRNLLIEKPDTILIASPNVGHLIKRRLTSLEKRGLTVLNTMIDLPEDVSRNLFAKAYGWGRVFKG